MNEEIERYVKEERSRGVGEETIRHTLIAKGWEYKLVDDIITETRPGAVASLFNPTFFHFAMGFVTVIMFAVGVIIAIGAVSENGGGGACVINCTK